MFIIFVFCSFLQPLAIDIFVFIFVIWQKKLSPLVSSEVHCAKAGGQIASKLTHLILSHYDLASTTVTGIPMKEEQNASSSANYDVEMFHPSQAHAAILRGMLCFNLVFLCWESFVWCKRFISCVFIIFCGIWQRYSRKYELFGSVWLENPNIGLTCIFHANWKSDHVVWTHYKFTCDKNGAEELGQNESEATN